MSVDNSNSNVWTVAEARAKLGEVIERALSGKPQTITRKGRSAVMIVAAEECERSPKCAGNLASIASSIAGRDWDALSRLVGIDDVFPGRCPGLKLESPVGARM